MPSVLENGGEGGGRGGGTRTPAHPLGVVVGVVLLMMSWSGERRGFPRAVRAAILKRDRVCRCSGCVCCTPAGCGERSVEADHRTPFVVCRRAGVDPDTIDNGQGLCVACHAEKTRGEQREGRERMRGRRTPRLHPAEGGGRSDGEGWV